MLDVVATYQSMQCQIKLMIQTQENDKKSHFEPDLRPFGTNSGCKFFFKNLASSVTRYHGLSSCIIPEKKTNHPILSKLSEGWADGQTDRSDFIGFSD